MESIGCLLIVAAVFGLSTFVYVLNTARKKGSPPKTAKRDYLPLYITIADKPDSITRGMDRFVAEVQRTESAGDKWRWIPMFIFLGGIGLAAIDGLLLLLGFQSFVFATGGIILWIAAIVMARGLRKSDSKDFAPRYKGTQDILYTLRDDLKPGSTFNGHLDLTGAMLPAKVARSTNDSRDRTTEYFRDEWLALKAKLYDGNILRLSAVQKSKKRKSYWKRSRISGKMKLKPEKFKGTEHDLKVRIVANPELYTVAESSPQFNQGLNIGKFTISQLDTQGGMISFVANSPFEDVQHENILQILQSAYSLLQRKAAQ